MTDANQRELEKKWRAELEKMGVEVVMLNLNPDNVGPGRGAAFRALFPPGVPETYRGFVEDWVAEKNRKLDQRGTRRFLIAALTALLAVVVALAGIHLAGK